MDLPHQLHQHAAKRQRLNEDPTSWAKITEEQIEEPCAQFSIFSFHQASSNTQLALSAAQQAFSVPESYDFPTQTYLESISSRSETNLNRPDFNRQLSNQVSRLNDSHGLAGSCTSEIQPTTAWYQPGPCSDPSSTYSLLANAPIPSPTPWLHRAVHPQLVQAQSFTLIPMPCQPYPVASFQAPCSTQQSLEPPSGETLSSFIPENGIGIHDFDDTARFQLDKDRSEVVCFGMVSSSKLDHKFVCTEHLQITAISARCGRQNSCEISLPFPVQIDSFDRFSMKDRPEVHGRILPEHGQMIQGLLDEQALDLHVSCTLDSESSARKSSRNSVQLPCTLDITVYGPLELFEEIGSWFQEYEVYLQDPRVCHLNVKYSNPQRLSSDDLDSCPLVSEVVSQTSRLVHLQDIMERPDLLDILSSYVELEETPQPAAIRAVLKR